MGGHSHWSTIKRQKGASDARRGQLFTKLGREIAVAARQGGPDLDANPRLRLAIQKAREHNMPADTIERAIKRGSGQLGAAELVEATYEGYGPGGVAILLTVLTDNRNRAVSEIRTTLSRAGGSLADSGSVTWLFDNKGLIVVQSSELEAEELGVRALDAGAEDVKIEEDGHLEIYTVPEDLERVREALAEVGATLESAEVAMVPKTTVPLSEREAEAALRLLDRLEELDDVQQVYSNAEFPDQVLAAYASR